MFHAPKEPLHPLSLHSFSLHSQASRGSSVHLLVPFSIPSLTICIVTSAPTKELLGPRSLLSTSCQRDRAHLDHLLLFWTLLPWFLGYSSPWVFVPLASWTPCYSHLRISDFHLFPPNIPQGSSISLFSSHLTYFFLGDAIFSFGPCADASQISPSSPDASPDL